MSALDLFVTPVESGPAVLTHADFVRMGKQRAAVLAYMAAGAWWTLAALSDATGYPEASVSARLRDFRKPKHGAHTVERKREGPGRGTWVYRVVLNGGGR